VKHRAIIFKDKILIMELSESMKDMPLGHIGNTVWFKSYNIDSVHTTKKKFNKLLNKYRVEELRKARNIFFKNKTTNSSREG